MRSAASRSRSSSSRTRSSDLRRQRLDTDVSALAIGWPPMAGATAQRVRPRRASNSLGPRRSGAPLLMIGRGPRCPRAGRKNSSLQFSLCKLTVQDTGPDAPRDVPLQWATSPAPRRQTSWSAYHREPSLQLESLSRSVSEGPSKRDCARVRQLVRPRHHSSCPLPLASKQ